MTYFVALAFLAILASLGAALFFMMKDGTDGKKKTDNIVLFVKNSRNSLFNKYLICFIVLGLDYFKVTLEFTKISLAKL